MSPESRVQITVKLPSELHSSLSQAIKESKYQNMTVAIITALEKELQEPAGMSTDLLNNDSELQKLTEELQKNVTDIQVMRATFEGIQRLTEEKDKQIEELNKHNSTLKADLEKASQDKEDLKQMHNNYFLQVQTLINQKAIEAPGEKKKPFWKFW